MSSFTVGLNRKVKKHEPFLQYANYNMIDVINNGNLPYTDYICTQTLCRDGEPCDFRFARHETDAGDSREHSKSVGQNKREGDET